ncbi:multidrug resistance-associated protein 4-like isoform X2 [Acanthaster planci]|uniref:Multidrug resistance-associated protein 4-like isoform X2 n=1 Tax=Acanthaster planci TaxID=133434 RepID=A0A8B7YIL6_ACAPL|nr:multidrug resistance-associated protein 4-like isoform X2 [Acanthaster planci]
MAVHDGKLTSSAADNKKCNSESQATDPSRESCQSGRQPHPLLGAGLFSQTFFTWMFGFFRRGYKRPLVEEDLYDVLPDHSAGVLVSKLESEWNKELNKSNITGRSPSLPWALFRVFGVKFMLYSFPAFIEEVILKMVQTVMLARLILYFSTDLVSTNEAYLQAVGLSLTSLGFVVVHHYSFFGFGLTGMMIRTACSALVFRKALKLSNVALGETAVGQLVNILSNDVNKFDQVFLFLTYLWIAPIQLTVMIVLCWREIGVSCLAGISVIILMAPFQVYTGKLFSKLRSKTALLSDARLRVMNEVISGMRVIKIFAWEQAFEKLVTERRREEIRKILHTSYLRAVIYAFLIDGALLTTFVTFLVYASLGNPVTSSKVFPVLSLLYRTRTCLCEYFPLGLINRAEGLVSMLRIQKFLLMGEIERHASEASVENNANVQRGNPAITLDETAAEGTVADREASNASVTEVWTGISQRLDREARVHSMGCLIDPKSDQVIRGYVGPAGIHEEEDLSKPEPLADRKDWKGIVMRNVYASWNKNVSNSVLQNISFCVKPGELLAVIGPVGCGKDVELLPHGDQTLVGERGVTLSGGQRARVSLARALYSEADVYLLDDPLSAVDPTVGRHLFETCILHQMRDRARVLVTHQLQFLDKADKILILKQGSTAGYGTYRQLQEEGVDFATFLKKQSEDVDYAGEKQMVLKHHTRERNISTHDNASFSPVQDEVETPINISPEEKAVGVVDWKVYIRYIRAAAGLFFLFVWVIVAVGGQALLTFTDFWLATWAYEEEKDLAVRNQDNQNDTTFDQQPHYIRIYAILCGGSTLVVFVRSFLFFHLFVSASKALHNQVFADVIRAPMQFFDKNPVGRILNRFSKDIGFMDDLLPATFSDFLRISLDTIAYIILISTFNPFCLAFTLPIVIVFFLIRRFYLASSRDVMRLEGIARSPVFSHLSVTLTGLSTVRAFKAQQRFTADFDRYLDSHTRAWFLFLATSRWLGVQLDFLSSLFVCGVSFTCILTAGFLNLNSGTVGLSLTYAISLLGVLQWAVRRSAELENQMTSVERVCQYIDIKPEAPLETDLKPPPDWPQDGGITLHDTSLRYTPDGPQVLQNISCSIKPREKVGIVGRTGAGKSSLMTVLMRLAEPTGTIMIDGVNTAPIGLHDLRKKVSFIPQDPLLFSGTLRKNLDPFGEHADWDLWRAIEEVELKPAVEELPDKLEAVLTEGGTNLSVGQRQLLCLARAILRQNKILIVDEATANVDVRTDRLIQATIRQRFKHCTVLTIAHRLNTIMDSDKVMVLDAGRLIEFEEPYILLQKEDGAFTRMVQETGKAETAELIQIAADKHAEKAANDPEDVDVSACLYH